MSPGDLADSFVHEALFYRDDAEYLAGTIPFISGGLAAAEPVLVAVPGANGELIRGGLGSAAASVRIVDMTMAGRNPGRIIPTVLLAFIEEHRGARVRIIGEPIWAGRTNAEYPMCVQHEALINVAVAGRPATILCPYDTARLETAVLMDAERTHPVLAYADRRESSERYTDPFDLVATFNRPLPEPLGPVSVVPFGPDGLPRLRDTVALHADAAGLAPDRALAMQLAVHELAANAVEHATGSGTLRIWRDRHELVCEVADTGHLADPLAGRREPPLSSDGGRGLLLVHSLTDLVELHTVEGATTVRVRMSRH